MRLHELSALLLAFRQNPVEVREPGARVVVYLLAVRCQAPRFRELAAEFVTLVARPCHAPASVPPFLGLPAAVPAAVVLPVITCFAAAAACATPAAARAPRAAAAYVRVVAAVLVVSCCFAGPLAAMVVVR